MRQSFATGGTVTWPALFDNGMLFASFFLSFFLSFLASFFRRIRGLLHCSAETSRGIFLHLVWGIKPRILLSIFVLCGLFLFGAAVAPAWAAENIIYNQAGDYPLLPDPVGNASNSLFPSTSTSGNTVTVNGGTVGRVIGGVGANPSSADNNTVTITGGTIDHDVYGGFGRGTGTANNNRVVINGGTFTSAMASIAGGTASAGGATGNSVVFNAGSVSWINGGEAGSSGGGAANGNTVEIRGGTVTFMVSGGWINNGSGGAVNNTVSIYNAPDLSAAILAGGTGNGVFGASSGNTLNLHAANLTVQGLRGFQNYNFYLPSTLTAGQTMLTVTNGNGHILGIGTPGGPANINDATVNVGIEGGSSPLQQGNQVVLIDSTAQGLTGTLANTTADGQGMQGVTLRYTFDLQILNDQLLATVSSIGVNPQTKSLSEGRAAGYAFVNQGSDLIIGPGMSSALAATQGGLAPFGAASGGWSRYNTGSHVDVSGFSLMAGLGWGQPVNDKGSSLLAGAFIEAGWGGYDAYNSFSNAASVRGDGNTSYYGGGVLARYGASCGGYFDASFRAGRVATDFASSDLRDGMGNGANYDSGSAYYGAHAGLGYVWNITDKVSLDMSTRYIWTHQNSDTVNVLGDPVTFDSADSQRWRTGARFAYALNESIAPYVGVYYDHEFDGRARASTNGFAIDAPSLQGGTGMGELGLAIKPVVGSAFSLDLGVQGYIGVREGVSGSLQLKFAF